MGWEAGQLCSKGPRPSHTDRGSRTLRHLTTRAKERSLVSSDAIVLSVSFIIDMNLRLVYTRLCGEFRDSPGCHVVFPTAYKEKMKELSVLSLICSCFYPETRNKLAHEFEGMNYNRNIDFIFLFFGGGCQIVCLPTDIICPVSAHTVLGIIVGLINCVIGLIV